ncbi:D-alanyl-D-alanine carboxypeptidase/D-alanyl-D-alanine-endopeptidase [Patulibacter sp.]|uniref:D-alanyl-D-alanine carboxypeptidase/D-alanyl-D-alanine-endopeptidase n=1 Tax=Patulibacter sp. TaxID=1912859 RepID=UPI0027280364|nr:D-alanyl-D-alanine carboxypeptidase [Patulibacter sp.]MDO9408767.1 D-alanyl-D-alanine carboxypeptidase [Patulibacter sp.]
MRPARILTSATAVAATSALALSAVPSAGAAMPSTSGIGSRAGVVVVDLTTGRTLLSRGGSTARIPASVTKLFTVGAALRLLGPDWAPRTRVVATGSLRGTTWDGDLHLVGGGDPTLSTAAVKALAGRAVQALGADRLGGEVHVDATAFDDWQGGARTGRSADGDLGGRIGAATVDRGARTTAPAVRAGSLFRTALRTAGLQLTGPVVQDSVPPAGGTTVAVQAGPTLAQLAAGTLGPSDNFFAETLLKDIASRDGVEAACRVRAELPPLAPPVTVAEPPAAGDCLAAAARTGSATTAAGSLLLRTTLRPLAGTTPRIVDGSGLTRRNRVSPATVVRLLRAYDADPAIGPVLRAALPQAGRTGTLAGRMRGTAAVGRCAAKTGTINGVSGLAGYCTTRKGREVAFAILQNGGNVFSARSFQDRFVARLAQSG